MSSSIITDYTGRGTHADRPVSPPVSSGATALYYETDTAHLFAWDGSAWNQVDFGGTVSSIALTAPSIINVSGSPVTGSGTFDLTLANQNANLVLAGPTTGVPGTPAFRSLVAADIPNIDATSITSGSLDNARLSGITTTQLSASAGITSGQIASVAASTITGILGVTKGGTGLDTSGATNGQLLIGTGTGLALAALTAGSGITITNASGGITVAATGSGTVTSVALTAPAEITVAGSPITGAGTLGLTWASETQNFVFAAPSASSGTPSFRALVAGDIPNLDTGKITTGLLSNARGGTGVNSSTAANGQLLIGNGSGFTLATLTAGTNVTITNASGAITIASTGGGGGSTTLAGDTDVSIASPVGGQVLGYSDALSKWVNQNQAGVAATTSTAQLGADVTMTAANTFYDGPSVALSPGTWLLVGAVKVLNVYAGKDYIEAKLWDGTTVFASGEFALSTVISDVVIPFSAIVTPTTATTYKISCASTGTNNVIKAALEANAAGNTASYLQAIQLSGNPVGQQAPAVRAYSTTTQSIINNTNTNLTFNSTRYDQGTTTAQHSNSTNTSRLTCQQAGVYQIGGEVYLPTTAGGERIVAVILNGSTEIGRSIVPGSSAADAIIQVNCQYSLSVGDYVELQVYQNSSVTITSTVLANSAPEFWMARIDSGPGAVQPNTKVQLQDIPTASDVANGVSLPATTWTDLRANQTFTVDDASSVIEICPSVAMQITGASASGQNFVARIVIDSGGTPITRVIGMTVASGTGGQSSNPFSGAGAEIFTGLSAGSHTVKVQVYGTVSGTMYCRPNTQPNLEAYSLTVLERKQSLSPPSSTPAPAVRCYNSGNQSTSSVTDTAITFDTNSYDQGTSTPQHSTSSATSRLVCQQAGVYLITGQIRWASNGTNARQNWIRLNGTTQIAMDERQAVTQASQPTFGVVSTIHSLTVGDYVELMGTQYSASTLNVEGGNGDTHFMMSRIDTGGTGAVYVPVVKIANYVILPTDSMVVAGANGLTLTLPAASAYTGKPPLVIKNDNFTATSIARAGSDTIDGATSYSLSSAYQSISLVSDAVSVWRVI